MPVCPRIHVTSLDSTSVTTNWRSSSLRCAMVDDRRRGRSPSSAPMSSGTPALHAANDGEASRPFSRIAERGAVLRREERVDARTRRACASGGCVHLADAASARSRLPAGAPRVLRIKLASRMCSRLDSGSASMPTSPSRLVDDALDLVAQRSRPRCPGRRPVPASEPIDVQRHARLGPGRVDRDVLAGEVAHVALGVQDQRRDPGRERLLEQHDPEPGLARARSCPRSRRGW